MKNSYIVQSVGLAAALWISSAAFGVASAVADDIAVSDDGSPSEQVRPRIAVSPGQGFVVVWEDKRSGASDIYQQRFDLAGGKLGLNIRVNDDTGAIVQTAPSAAVDGFGKYMVVWQDYRNGAYPFGPQIYGQLLDSAGNSSGVNRRLTIEQPDSLRAAPDIALAPWGGGLVVWQDYRNRNWDVYAQRIGADGSLVGTNFKINDDQNLAQQHAPRVAVAPDGWYIVTWYDNRWGNDDIFVQRLDSSGKAKGPNVKVNSDVGASRQAFPDVAADGVGHFTVVWVDWRNGTYPNDPDIYARKFDTLFTPLYADMRVNKDASSRAQKDPSIAADRLGNVGIVWSDSGATSFDIAGQMIDVDGNIREQNFRANTLTDSAQVQPSIALDGRYRYVGWADKRAGNWDIYASVTKYNNPTLVPSPQTLSFATEKGKALPAPKSLVLSHAGYNRLTFRLKSSAAWLAVTPTAGTTIDTVSVSVTDSTLPAGTYSGTITLVDEGNHDSSVYVPVTFVYREPSPDTLRIGSIKAVVDSTTPVPIWLIAGDSTLEITVPLAFDSSIMRADSFVRFDTLPANASSTYSASTDGKAVVTLHFDSSSPLLTGKKRLGNLWITAFSAGVSTLDTGRFDTLGCEVRRITGQTRVPIVQAGDVTADVPTDVNGDTSLALPKDFSLAQNYPNPFNGSTVITFSLSRPGSVLLEVYNVLGQRVATLVSRQLSAGRQTASWNGRSDTGSDSPSGVYFYRLQVRQVSLVQKMIFLK